MTEEEYNRLCGASEGQGARSVSEFARNTLLTTSGSEHAAPAHCHCSILYSLDERISKVEHEVAEIKDEILQRRPSEESL